MAEQPLLLTVEQFAERANMGRTLTYAKVAAGEIESVKIGRLRRIPADELEKFVARLRAAQSTGVAA
jgi:excisionase family DNA binding protein